MNQPDSQKPTLLLLLCPPRSFSSVVCTMLGQHPEMYGFPELRLFVADTVDGILHYFETQKESFGLPTAVAPGLLRALAELHFGGQSPEAVAQAHAWLLARGNWSVGAVFDSLLERIRPRIGVEKSPPTARWPEFLNRAGALYPHARFLHLTRHPVTTQRSMLEHWQARFAKVHPDWALKEGAAYCAGAWQATHQTVLDFTRALPADQTMRVRGEDLLSDPDTHLTRIAAWLGVRTDADAIEAMKHPERSPYASRGPASARNGNDPKFLQDPHLRPATCPAALEMPPEWELEPDLQAAIVALAVQMGYAGSGDKDPAVRPSSTDEPGF